MSFNVLRGPVASGLALAVAHFRPWLQVSTLCLVTNVETTDSKRLVAVFPCFPRSLWMRRRKRGICGLKGFAKPRSSLNEESELCWALALDLRLVSGNAFTNSWSFRANCAPGGGRHWFLAAARLSPRERTHATQNGCLSMLQDVQYMFLRRLICVICSYHRYLQVPGVLAVACIPVSS